MPEHTESKNYGDLLPDQVERIFEFYDAHLEVISDVRELYTARVALEREFAGKLQLLCRKAEEKKAKAQISIVVGKEPAKVWDSDIINQSTLNAAYNEILTSMTSSAQDHLNHADTITLQTVEKLRTLEKHNEEAKKKEMIYFQKLLSDRDRIYTERLKSKQKVDCAEVESFRQKQGRASDDRHADRAAKQAEQQRNDMLNSKNSYLISTAVGNHVKAKFYQHDLPQLENEIQALQRRLVERFVKVLIYSQQLELSYLDGLKSRVANVDIKLHQVDTPKDQNLFIEYNLRTFVAPDDWKFEPCSIHYDTDTLSTEPTPKIVIQNKLRRSREKLTDLIPLLDAKRTESNQLSLQVFSYNPDHSVGVIDELVDRYLEAEHQVAFYTTSERILNAEIDSILAVVGNDQGASKPHSFKSSSFSIPTQCGYCQSTIWGLSKQGKTCRACGLSVHSKCELKVPASCKESEERPPSMVFKKSTDTSRSGQPGISPALAPSASSFVQSIASEEFSEEHVEAKVVFDFRATSEFELDVAEGMKVKILEVDDGSGWVKVVNKDGYSGLVPASYVEVAERETSNSLDSQHGTGERVRAIYPYTAQSSEEIDLQEGDILILSSGLNGGKSYGNGWWEGFNAQGRKGIFPNNYVEPV